MPDIAMIHRMQEEMVFPQPARTVVPEPTWSAPGSAGKRLPPEFLLGTLGDARLIVQAPIAVRWFEDQEQVVLEAPGLNEFGFGQTVSAALRDLQKAIVELYFALDEEKGRLGPDLLAVWDRLQVTVQKRA